MKFSIKLLAFSLIVAMITFAACDKEPPIVEEDLNGFDVDFEEGLNEFEVLEDIHKEDRASREIINAALEIQTDHDVLNQHIEGHTITKEGDMFVVYPDGMSKTKRSANPKMIFDNTPGTQGIMVKSGSGGWCGMGNFTGGVTFVLNANPLACAGTLFGCTDERMDWRQVVYVSGCNTSKLRYINSSGSVSDTDYMSREGYNWLYMRCSFEGNGPGHADIRQGSCGSSYSGKYCDES